MSPGPPGSGATGPVQPVSTCCGRGATGQIAGIHPSSGRARPGYPEITPAQLGELARTRASLLSGITNKRCNLSQDEWNDGLVNCPRGASNRPRDNVDASTGDANAFDGFQCLAGEGEIGCGWGVDCAVPVGTEPVESSSCLADKNAQGSEGRWWRSPDHVGLECGKSFSRDAALGTLAYLAKSRDVAAATRWWNYIQTQSWAIDFGLFTTDYTNLMCPDDHEPLYDYCGLLHTYGHWYSPRKSNEYYGIFHDVWFSLNLTIPKDVEDENNQNPDQQRKDHACEGLDPGRPGIQDYLLADQYLIKQFVGTESVLDRAGISCLVQRGPEEVLFAFLQEGSSAHVADLIIKDLPDQPRQCPADLASYTGKFQSGEGSFWY